MKAFDDFETQIQCEEAYLEQPDIGAGDLMELDTPLGDQIEQGGELDY